MDEFQVVSEPWEEEESGNAVGKMRSKWKFDRLNFGNVWEENHVAFGPNALFAAFDIQPDAYHENVPRRSLCLG